MIRCDLELGTIVTTSRNCTISGQLWDSIPALVWPEGVDEAASDWFRTLVVENGVSAGSAREYAKILRPFLRFCRERNRAWESVDDDFLIAWREHLLRAKKVSSGRANTAMKTIFAFYRWAEETKRLKFRVGIYSLDELPAVLANTTFPISAKKSYTKGRNGRVYNGWTTPLTVSDPGQGFRFRHTPTEDEIRKLHEVAAERIHAERDSLMLSWAEEAGPRRAEFMRLCKSHLPASQQLAELIEHDEVWPISIRRKGGKLKTLRALPELIIRTLDYIEFSRQEIVIDCQRRIVNYLEPDEIFISSRTGMPLHLDSVTAIGRNIFSKAGVKGANIHRLRARHAVRTIETLVDAIFDGSNIGSESSWVETILTKAAESMGHSSPRSLRPYLTYVLNRRIQTTDSQKVEKLSARLRQLSLYETTLQRRLEHQAELHRSSQFLRAGKVAEAAMLLRNIADQLD